jgi:hypothetical protein
MFIGRTLLFDSSSEGAKYITLLRSSEVWEIGSYKYGTPNGVE